MTLTRPARTRAIAAVVAAAASCTSALVAAPSAIGTPTVVSAASTLAWAPCDDPVLASDGFECTRLSVPADRDDPQAGSFSLALVRHRSTGDAAQRIGSLVFNPGGPGGSGLQFISGIWPILPKEVKQRFDLVTWDPRGVNESRPALVGCRTPWPVRPATGAVDWARVVRGFNERLGAANRACQQRNADIVNRMSTVENVEDLDRIRAALGEDTLTYWGMSYGTRIGYVYALRHPDRVRAMVLDGSIDPSSRFLGLTQGGAAPDQAYGSFADIYPDADRQLDEVLAALQTRTVLLPGGREFTRWDVLDPVYSLIAQQDTYPVIAGLASLWHAAILGSGAEQQQAAALSAVVASSFAKALPNSNAGGVFSVVNCLDYAGRPAIDQAISAVRYQAQLGPVYGGSLGTMFAVNCAGLDLEPDPVPLITGAGSSVPALILGASRDGSTIVQWTARMSRAFPQSRTVTYAGGQHVTWVIAGSSCVNAVANRYVIDVVLPARDRACPNVAKALPPQSFG